MDNEQQSKTAFAAILYNQPGANPFEAALSLFPDTSTALLVSQTWPRDVFVLEEIARFAGEQSDKANQLPDKQELCREVWKWVTAPMNLATIDEKIKAAKLYAEINSMIVKEAPTATHNTNTVMYVTDFGTELSWEQQMQRQQQGLIDDGVKDIEGALVDATNS